MTQSCGSCGFQFQSAGAFCPGCGAARAQAPQAPQAPVVPQAPQVPPVPGSYAPAGQQGQPGSYAPAGQQVPPVPAGYAPAGQPAAQPFGQPASQQFAGQPPYAGQPGAEAPKKKRTGLVVGIGALVLAVGGATAIGWAVLGKGGGASSPEAAVQKFLDAAVEEDVVGMLDQILPGEVEGAAEAFEQQRDELVKDGDMAKEGITDAITMSAKEWELEVDNVEDSVALVTLADTDFKVEWDMSKIESDALEGELDLDSDDMTKGAWPSSEFDLEVNSYSELKKIMEDEAGVTPTLVAVEEDGRWYVSILASIQNTAFEAAYYETGDSRWNPKNLDWKTVSEGHDPVVGKDSKEVVEQVFTAIEKQDLNEGLALLPQSQVRSLWASIGALNDLMQEDLPEPGSLALEVKEWDASEKEIGDGLVEVRVKSATLGVKYTDTDTEYYDDSFEAEVRFEDGCGTVVSSYAEGYGEEEDPLGCLSELDVNREVFENGEIVLIMREVDGGMQFDPLATAVHYAEVIEPSSLNPGAWDL